MRITNAGQASYPHAWSGYNVCASYDRCATTRRQGAPGVYAATSTRFDRLTWSPSAPPSTPPTAACPAGPTTCPGSLRPSPGRKEWFRVPTTYDKEAGVLHWAHTPAKGAVFYAFFAPYTYEQHQSLVAEMQCHENVTMEMLVGWGLMGAGGEVSAAERPAIAAVHADGARMGYWEGSGTVPFSPPLPPRASTPPPFVFAGCQGETLDGHDLDLLRIGEDTEEKRKIWVLARQHPGESMAGARPERGAGDGAGWGQPGAADAACPAPSLLPRLARNLAPPPRPARPSQSPFLLLYTRPARRTAEYFVEGLLRRLVDRHDATSRALLQQCVFYVVPCMCPDGVSQGQRPRPLARRRGAAACCDARPPPSSHPIPAGCGLFTWHPMPPWLA